MFTTLAPVKEIAKGELNICKTNMDEIGTLTNTLGECGLIENAVKIRRAWRHLAMGTLRF